jgi:anti-anti-sigma factor
MSLDGEGGIRIRTRRNGGSCVLELSGQLDATSHRALKAAYEPPLASASVSELLLDFAELEVLDSSAFGLLLILRERGLARNKPVYLVNSRGQVAEALAEARFYPLFAAP